MRHNAPWLPKTPAGSTGLVREQTDSSLFSSNEHNQSILTRSAALTYDGAELISRFTRTSNCRSQVEKGNALSVALSFLADISLLGVYLKRSEK